jgi:hypothetical protein
VRKAALTAAALAAAIGIGLLVLRDRGEDAAPGARVAQGATAFDRTGASEKGERFYVPATRKSGAGTNAADAKPLPPLETPVATIMADLEARARTGDARAACRVAMEKVRCHRVLTWPTNAGRSTPEVEAAMEKDRGLCNGVELSRTEDAWRYLSQASLAGNVAAMSLFVRDPQLDAHSPIETAEGWLVYRDYAARFLASAIEGGDTMALFYAWWTSASGQATVGRAQEIFPKDPYRAIAYGTAAMPLLDPRRQILVSRLNGVLAGSMTTSQLDQARREGEDLRRRYFANATRPSESHDDTHLAPQDCAR